MCGGRTDLILSYLGSFARLNASSTPLQRVLLPTTKHPTANPTVPLNHVAAVMSDSGIDNGTLTQADSVAGTERDINLLYQIVTDAQNHVDDGVEDAIRGASKTVFEDEHVTTPKRQFLLDWLLHKVVVGAPPGELYGHFERVLKEELDIVIEVPETSLPPTIDAVQEDGDGVQRPRLGASAINTVSIEPLAGLNRMNDNVEVPGSPPRFAMEWRRAEHYDQRKLVIDALGGLLPKRAESVLAMERRADYICERRLKYKVVSQWRNVVSEHLNHVNSADAHYEGLLRQKSHAKVFDAARVQRVHAMDEFRLKGLCLYKIMLAGREVQVTRTINSRLKAQSFRRLINHHRGSQAHQQQLEVILQQRKDESDKQVLHSAAQVWLQKTVNIDTSKIKADDHYEQPLKEDFMVRWREKTRRIEEAELTASDLREYFLKYKFLTKVKDTAQAQRNRREVLGRWTLSQWRLFTRSSKRRKYDQGYKLARRNHKHRIARRAFHSIQTEHERVSQLDRIADEHLKSKNWRLINAGIVSWYNKAMHAQQLEKVADTHAKELSLKHTMGVLDTKSSQVQMMKNLADQYHGLHVKQVAGKALRQISMKAFDVHRKQQTADAFHTRQSRQTTRMNFDKWRVVAAGKRGEGPLRLPPATPAQQRAEDMIRLTSTTPLYTPARRSAFTARLRADHVMDGRMTQKILEEVEQDDENRDEMR